MKKNYFISIIIILMIYSVLSLILDKSFLLPSLPLILKSLFTILSNFKSLEIILITIARMITGLAISFIIAFILAYIAYYNKTFKELMEPLYLILKTIPNITYIIVSLIWFGRNGSVLLVAGVVVFPILYNSLLAALYNIDPSLNDLAVIEEGNKAFKFKKIYIPLIYDDVLTALKNSCSLGIKVSVMAEILAQVKRGIGRELLLAKNNFLMEDIFAWTIIIIVISYLFDLIIYILKRDSS